MRATVQRRIMDLPLFLGVPMGILKLMLDIEEPNAQRGSHTEGWEEYPQYRRKPPEQKDQSQRRQNHRIGAHRADPVFHTRAHQA